jgi:hypothetical protein
MKQVCIEIIDQKSEIGESRKYSLPYSSVQELNSQIDMLIEKTMFLKVTVYIEPIDFEFTRKEILELEDCELEVLNF